MGCPGSLIQLAESGLPGMPQLRKRTAGTAEETDGKERKLSPLPPSKDMARKEKVEVELCCCQGRGVKGGGGGTGKVGGGRRGGRLR